MFMFHFVTEFRLPAEDMAELQPLKDGKARDQLLTTLLPKGHTWGVQLESATPSYITLQHLLESRSPSSFFSAAFVIC